MMSWGTLAVATCTLLYIRAGRYNNYIRGLSTQLRATEDGLSLSNDVLFTIDTRCFSDCQSY